MTDITHTVEERYEFETGNPGDERCAAIRYLDESSSPQWTPWYIKLLSHADYCTRWVEDYMDLGDTEYDTWQEAVEAKLAAAAKRWESYR